jgi:hypothetical protein
MMVNPLDSPLSGMPDSATAATMVYRTVDLYDLTSATTKGAGALGIRPGVGISTITPTFTAATSTTTAWADGAAGSGNTEISAFALSRVLCYTVEYIPTGSLTSEQGLVSFTTYNLIAGAMPDVGDISVYQDDANAEVFQATTSGLMVVRPNVTPNLGSTTNSAPMNYLPTLVVALAGGNLTVGTVAGRIRVTRVIEAIPVGNSLSASTARVSGCSMCCIECCANMAGACRSATGKSPEEAKQSLVAKSMKAIKAAAKAYVTNDMTPLMALLNV